MNFRLASLILLALTGILLVGCGDKSSAKHQRKNTDTKPPASTTTTPSTTTSTTSTGKTPAPAAASAPRYMTGKQFEQAVVKLGAAIIVSQGLVVDINSCTKQIQKDTPNCIRRALDQGAQAMNQVHDTTLEVAIAKDSACAKTVRVTDAKKSSLINDYTRQYNAALAVSSSAQLKLAIQGVQTGLAGLFNEQVPQIINNCLKPADRQTELKRNPILKSLLKPV